ncbi:MAG: NAD(P)/FAD-dependent oxidoreductase [Betaproteobacteria bacterium]|nr:NAD(P)/FAD-dependent oxidoreductase [Betaproteobacteria bacterium]MDH4326189.1 NAD(P)/FAD-dependent oxidoreductase [Betaproteobacteria bacterium]MDH5211446.1 NAD(P)/FAD-dependent oxidoreductase [Betaproteobacteria bacterium]
MTPRIVILGCGFGGLFAARALRRAPAEIIVVDRTNHHLFQPLLYQVATAGLAAPAIAEPIRRALAKQKNVTVLYGEAQRVEIAARQVILENGEALAYDRLILATGATDSYFGHDDWRAHAPGLKTLEDAFEIRQRVFLAFEHAEREADPVKRAAWLTFVVIGAGATGVEMAGMLAEIARHTLKGEFRRFDPRNARVVLVEAMDRVLPPYTPDLSERARMQLERIGVTVWLGRKVTGIDARGVQLGGDRLEAKTVVWCAGVAASPLGATLGVPLERGGRVIVEPDLSVPGHPEIQVVGDLAFQSDHQPPVPGVAPAAKQMGRHAAHNIMAALAGKPTRPFRYRDYGQLATIGRSKAVAMFGRIHVWGWLAWVAWLTAHIYFLIGFRNRLVVLIDWAWAYWTFERSARVVDKGARPPG